VEESKTSKLDSDQNLNLALSQKNVELPDIGDFDAVDIIEVLVKVGDVVNENDIKLQWKFRHPFLER